MKTILWLLFWDEDVWSLLKTIPYIQHSDWHCLCYCFFPEKIMHLVQIQHHRTIVLSRTVILCAEDLSVHMLGTSGRKPVCLFLYCRFSGSFSLSKLILHFNKCAILSSAQTTDLWLKWQNLAESQQKAENVHCS